ncbi:MAG: glycosyltransferase, partial [Cyclobacteriaceae bacterium]
MKSVLIITYYWPPSGGSGVQRWLKFANYLTAMGWHPIIVTPENPQFELRDTSLEREVHPDIEVLKLPIWEPYQVFDKIRGGEKHEQGHTSIAPWAKFIRGNFFLPDPRIFWKRPVLKFLSEFLKQREVDFIISTGPPHSMHLIARNLKKKFGIPWLADFRDPWGSWDMLDEFRTTRLARSMHRSLERKVMNEADIVLTVSNTWAREMSDEFGREVEVITNGYDTRDFKNLEIKGDGKFRVA